MKDPHDRFARAIFRDPEPAAALFQAFLPAGVVRRFDWSRLRHVSASFVDDVLGERRADLHFEVPAKNRGQPLHLLLEHQSTGDPGMPFRMLRGITRVWEEAVGDQAQVKSLPPVVPVLLHNGRRRWNGPTHLSDLYGSQEDSDPELNRYLPQLEILLIDLPVISDEELHHLVGQNARAHVALLLLKYTRGPNLLVRLENWAGWLRAVLDEPGGLRALERVIRYILSAGRKSVDVHRLEVLLSRILEPKVGELVMTIAEKLKEEGWIEGRVVGREEGREEGRTIATRDILTKQLTLRFGALDESTRRRIAAADFPTIERWLERIFSATSVDELLAS